MKLRAWWYQYNSICLLYSGFRQDSDYILLLHIGRLGFLEYWSGVKISEAGQYSGKWNEVHKNIATCLSICSTYCDDLRVSLEVVVLCLEVVKFLTEPRL